jgi:hypothetical protein
VARSSTLAAHQRHHHLKAVAGETLQRLAAPLIELPRSIAWTSA